MRVYLLISCAILAALSAWFLDAATVSHGRDRLMPLNVRPNEGPEEEQVSELNAQVEHDPNVDRQANSMHYRMAVDSNRIRQSNRRRPGPPIVLIPGDGGTQLDAKLDKPEVVHYFCDKKTSDYFNLWLNLALLVPFVVDCWVDNMRLVYDNVTRTTSNSPGVDIRVPGWGNTTTVEYVDPSRVPITAYFAGMVTAMVAIGYERGFSIRGAPFDFRKAPNEMHDYFMDFKQLVEETVTMNDNEPAILICHSMGCLNTLYFFNRLVDSSWKTRYVKSLVTLGGPWGGAVKALKAFASGDNLGVIVVPALTIREDERTFPSTAYLLPSDKFWGSNEVLISSPTRNYTALDYTQFFKDVNEPVGYAMYLDTRNLTYELTPPDVELHCLHGFGIDTIEKVSYEKGKFPDGKPSLVFGDGDGTVNGRSLEGCLRWKGQQSQAVRYKKIEGADHMLIMGNPTAIEYVRDLVLGRPLPDETHETPEERMRNRLKKRRGPNE